ncbi:helix-turn-helix domain-containing protein [Parasedimentitalea huanghaiensis]|uniref:HTH cro/C1-type domain-containing protein n=1 Tax=Parasedimentitalea huanghaiensis TaxID=2682100 RepID=A0A6L6WHP3_9RHOB|nr:helix-turn-helix transcriptional regulator [Zongyanglinia huanghaiensis]MVO16831.1 hypothetical protein [Zongyanglinia huanghaiensis]
MLKRNQNQQELRDVLGANLRRLTKGLNVTQVARDLDIHRTQFNRYLHGESFPGPALLARICRHFKVDANILIRPIDETPETPERIALRHAIKEGRFDCAGDLTLTLTTLRAFRSTETARFILAQCAGAVNGCEFDLLVEEAGFSDLPQNPVLILEATL